MSVPTPVRLFCATWSRFHADASLRKLPQTARSATALGGALRELGALAAEPVRIEDSAGAACVTAVEDFLRVDRADHVIVYLASHGLVSGRGQPFRLATRETRNRNDLTRALPLHEITERLARAGAARKLLVVDACYSGRVGGDLFHQAFADGVSADDICLLASSSPFEPSTARDGEDLTAFAGALIAILESGLPDAPPALSVRQLYEEVKRRMPEGMPEPRMFAQGDAADTIVLRNAAASANGDAGPAAQGSLGTPYGHHAEILYVDDNRRFLNSFRRALERAGHRVTVAVDARSAAEKLTASYYDIIVLDLLKEDDLPAKDLIQLCNRDALQSEIFLASRRDTRTSEANWKQLHAIFQYPSRISAFLWKPHYTTAIERRAAEIRERRRCILSKVPSVEDAAPLIAGRMIGRDASLAELSESLQIQARITIERLLAKWLGPQNGASVFVDSMRLRPVDSGHSACSVFKVEPRLAGIETRDMMPLILKIGPLEEIGIEVERYDRFVQVGVPLDLRTDRVGADGVGRVGGILYSFRGGRDGTIQEVGQLGPKEISRCLNVVFDWRTSRRWSAARGASTVLPVEYFERVLGFSDFRPPTDALRESLEEMLPDEDGDADERPTIESVDEWPISTDKHETTLVHGDLTFGNLIRCGKRRYALIDYKTVEIGPRLIDFATIEVNCWLTAPAPEESRSALFAQAREAIAPRFHDPRPNRELPDWLVDARRLAMECRFLAVKNHRDATAVEYATLLWMAAVRRSTFKSGATSAAERRALKVIPAAVALAAQAMIPQGDDQT